MSETRRHPDRHPDIYTPAEAVVYLGLHSEESLRNLRKKGMLVGHDCGTNYMVYHKEDLDLCALKMCGKDLRKPKEQQLRLA